MKPIAVLTALFALWSCYTKREQSTVRNSTTAAVYLDISHNAGERVESAYLAVPGNRLNIAICLAAESCLNETTNQVQARHLGKRDETQYYEVDLNLLPDAEQIITVIDADKQEVLQLLKFISTEPPADPIESGLASIQTETLKAQLTHLASDDFRGRLAGTPENDQAADFIISKLKEFGVQPGNQGEFRQSFSLNQGPTSGQTTDNIIGLLPGRDPELKNEYIVIGAHMDHTGTLARGFTCSRGAGGSNNICNGADDNGSGTIAVLNVAKALSRVQKHLKRSIILMWFSGEELGLIGSNHYVNRQPIYPLAQTAYMINMDMVGYLRSNGGNLGALGGETSRLAAGIIQELDQKYSAVRIGLTSRAGGGSDHVPFMRRGIPGVFFNTGVSSNRNYHSTSDTPDRIDYAGLTLATKIAFELALKMSTSAKLSDELSLASYREPLVTEEEAQQTCHHLIKNPYVQQMALDFRHGPRGKKE